MNETIHSMEYRDDLDALINQVLKMAAHGISAAAIAAEVGMRTRRVNQIIKQYGVKPSYPTGTIWDLSTRVVGALLDAGIVSMYATPSEVAKALPLIRSGHRSRLKKIGLKSVIEIEDWLRANGQL